MNKNIHLIADASAGGTPAPTVADLQKQLAERDAKIAQLENQQAVSSDREKAIAAKMVRGLSRSQAIAVLDRQAQYDAGPTAEERASRKAGETIEERTKRSAQIKDKHAKKAAAAAAPATAK